MSGARVLASYEGLRRRRARGSVTYGVLLAGLKPRPSIYTLLVGCDGENGLISSAAKAAAGRTGYGTAKQLAEKVTDAASGVKTPDENARFMSELKLRPHEKQTFSAACGVAAGVAGEMRTTVLWCGLISLRRTLTSRSLALLGMTCARWLA